MTTFLKRFLVVLLVILVQFVFISPQKAYAATSPDLGQAASFSILSSTYTNTVVGTTINGDLGYTTGPAWAPTVNGVTYVNPASKYTVAGTDQAAALADINGQACTFTWAPGAIDLATDNLHNGGGTPGEYVPGVYCTGASSAASIGTGGITLVGSGTYIFKIDGALTTVDGSAVTLSDEASACDLFWAPIAATTLGAKTTFAGTNIDASGITIGSTTTWTGRALAFGGTVSTDTDTITSTRCTAASTPAPSPTPGPTPIPLSCSGDQHLDASGTNCVSFSQAGPPPQSGGTTPTSAGQVLGTSTLASTGSFDTNAGLALMVIGFVVTLSSLYVFKKRAV